MSDCINCIRADVSYGSRVIKQGNSTIIQNGGCNITCTTSGVSISFDMDCGKMVCNGFKPREVCRNEID